MDGVNRRHAILGVSDRCIAAYPGDFAVALVALDATVRVMAAGGVRTMRVEDLHREPGDTPQIETVLDPGDLILGFHVPGGAWTRRALYLKIRDRESYEFALVSAAVALDMSDGVVRSARVALGGVATKPWRAREAEESLSGRPLTEESASQCAEIAFRPAVTRGGNAFKAELGRRALVRALLRAAALEV